MSSIVNGKRVLFIGPIFYHYHTAIINELKNKGAEVFFFPERHYNIKYGLSKRIGLKYFEKKQARYYFEILERTVGEKFDYFFLLKGEVLPVSFVEELRKRNPGIICIQYQWDSAKRNRYVHLLRYFDKTVTFDSKDAKEYGIAYQPLFYTEEIARISSSDFAPVFDLLMLGTYLPEREAALRKLILFCEEHHFSLKYHLFLKKIHYFTNFLNGKRINKDISSFESLPYQEVVKLYAQSRVIVDLSNVHQSGLSMRVIEALGAGKKLITTNRAIKQEPFYNEDFICVIDIEQPKVEARFVNSNVTVDRSKIEELHLSKWLERLFVF